MQELFLYSKENCGLCEKMLVDIHKIIDSHNVSCHVIDITDDLELEQRYGARIPVLVAGVNEICELSLDTSKLLNYLTTSP